MIISGCRDPAFCLSSVNPDIAVGNDHAAVPENLCPDTGSLRNTIHGFFQWNK